jgi:hypothetical protein
VPKVTAVAACAGHRAVPARIDRAQAMTVRRLMIFSDRRPSREQVETGILQHDRARIGTGVEELSGLGMISFCTISP